MKKKTSNQQGARFKIQLPIAEPQGEKEKA